MYLWLMLGYLILLFTLIPAIEIYLLINIGGQIGASNTIAIIVITGIVGAYLAKSQGLAIIGKIQTEINNGALPAVQMVHGLLVFGGGLLLLTPGFLTDAIGFSMVIPGTRHIIVKFAQAYFTKAVRSGAVHVYTNMNSSRHQRTGEFEFQDLDNTDNVIEADFEKK